MCRKATVWTWSVLLLAGCQSSGRSDNGGHHVPNDRHRVEILDIGPATYAPREGMPVSATEAAACAAWTLDTEQSGTLLSLSRTLPEDALHEFSWLPCTISGRARWNGREWQVVINAAGTSIWRNDGNIHLRGCSDLRCEPFVLLMPE